MRELCTRELKGRHAPRGTKGTDGNGRVAQLGERQICILEAAGSTPVTSTESDARLDYMLWLFYV